jgi:hypothetical protein
VGAVDGVNTASPTMMYVHVDHLYRPVKMTANDKTSLWDAGWTPWGTATMLPSDIDLFGDLDGVIDFNAEIAHGGLDL